MPKPRVNHSREIPSAHPTMSLALLVQVGAVPGPPGACSIISDHRAYPAWAPTLPPERRVSYRLDLRTTSGALLERGAGGRSWGCSDYPRSIHLGRLRSTLYRAEIGRSGWKRDLRRSPGERRGRAATD